MLSAPVSHTGMPGFTWPSASARFTFSALTPTSLEVIPPLAIRNRGFTVSLPTTLVTASEISVVIRS